MEWSEVIGQEDAKQRLASMQESGKMPHAILLCGPSGCGKMALAMAFACKLIRDSAATPAEAMLRKMEHPDLHFTFPTIKLPSMNSDYKPVSDDFIAQWREMVLESPYFTMDKWLNAMGADRQQAIITAGESDGRNRKNGLKSSQGV